MSNLLTWQLLAHWKFDSGVPAHAVSPDGRLVADRERSERGEEFTVVRRLGTGVVVCRLATGGGLRPSAVAFAPDGKSVAVSGTSGLAAEDTVRLFDTTTGRELKSFCAHSGRVCGLAFSPDGKRLATGSLDSTVLVWDLTALK